MAVPAVLAVIAIGAAACGSNAKSGGGSSGSGYGAAINSIVNPSSAKGGTLRFVNAADWDSPDPGNTDDAFSLDFMPLYGRSLMTYKQEPGNPGIQVVPDLAAAPGQVSSDGMTWTYKLKTGVKFQDGTPVTSADVKYAIERSNWGQDTLTNGPGYYKQVVQDNTNYQGPFIDKNPNDGVSGILTPDPQTIVFKLKSQFADMDYIGAMSASVPVPRAKDAGKNYMTSIQATGQYEIQNYTPGKSMTLVPNPNFDASTDPLNLHKVTASKITVAIGVAADDVDQQILNGQADIDLGGVGVQTTAQGQILADPAKKNQSDDPYTGALAYLTINTQVKPFDNIDCRKAVQYAINKTSVQSAFGGSIGGGDIATNILPPNISGYQKPASDPYAYSVTQAKSELSKCQTAEPASFKNGRLQTTFYGRSNRTNENNAEVAMKSDLAAAGIDVDIQLHPFGKYFSDFAGNPTQAKKDNAGIAFMKWGSDFPDGFGFLDQIVTKDGIHAAGGSFNLSYYDSPSVDALFTKALSTPDAAARSAIWTQVDQQVMADAAVVPLLDLKALLYRPTNVTNVTVAPAFGMYNFAIMGTTSK